MVSAPVSVASATAVFAPVWLYWCACAGVDELVWATLCEWTRVGVLVRVPLAGGPRLPDVGARFTPRDELGQVTELWRDIGFGDSAKADCSKKP